MGDKKRYSMNEQVIISNWWTFVWLPSPSPVARYNKRAYKKTDRAYVIMAEGNTDRRQPQFNPEWPPYAYV